MSKVVSKNAFSNVLLLDTGPYDCSVSKKMQFVSEINHTTNTQEQQPFVTCLLL